MQLKSAYLQLGRVLKLVRSLAAAQEVHRSAEFLPMAKPATATVYV